ncbi:TRAP transporter small permease [Niallia endozanthoxylica]|uniref:TRAP transporter small permease n=1 Tax=Niallia endozanthoxylica TaxID=2036016 RepID=A0A5J5I7G6_9BACI|nr:TRAP transporter small permease [Niallia endozanthoxylica]KAA9032376.1 TRAP transporter small permease [Niallia endozanthoxylica]
MANEKKNVLDWLFDICLAIVNVLMSLLIVIIILDVIMTYFFNAPLKWALEVSEYALAFIAFLGSGWLMREEGHLRFEMVIEKLPQKVRSVFEIFGSLVCLLVSLVIVWSGIEVVMSLYEKGALFESVLQWPRWPLIAAIPVGFSLLAIQLLRRSIQHIKNFKALKS